MNPGSVVLITGANSGMGLACAKALAERGCRVYGTYRDPKRAGELLSLTKSLPVFPRVMDVDDGDSVKKAVAGILKKEGRVDVLINNAGFVVAGFWEDLSERDIRSQFETNVFGLLRVTREVLPAMRKQRSGRILNIGSIAGFASTPVLGLYSASKFAVTALTETLRVETREWGIDVTEIAPGEIKTGIVQNTRMGKGVRSTKSPYCAYTREFEKFSQMRFKKAAPVEKLVKTVLKALEDSPMKRIYLVKPDDKVMYFIKWLLPDVAWEWGLAKMFPWSKFPK